MTEDDDSGRTPPPAWLASLMPGLAVASRYRRAWLRHDLVAGLLLTALLVPQGMAYAELAGLPPVTGLYATVVPLLVYALAGPSRILVLGPDSALAPIVAAAIVPLAVVDSDERVALAGLLALMVGALLLVGRFARLGFLTDLLSRPVQVGYLAGIAVIVIADQSLRLLGIESPGGHMLGDLSALVRGVGGADAATAMIGLACLAVILGLARVTPIVPGTLIAVVGATALVRFLDLPVAIVGEVPSGLPAPSLPSPSVDDLGRLALSALPIALLAAVDTSVLSRSYASRLGQRVDQNHELGALGVANVATGLFQGFPISSSSSRTPVAEAAGARSQLTGIVAAVTIAVLLVVGTGLLAEIPEAALAAVVIAAVLRLIDLSALRWLFDVDRIDFGLAGASFLGVVIFGLLPGVGIAIGLSVLAVLERAWHPYTAVLGRVDGSKGYHDVVRHPEGRQVPGLLIFRFDAPLFFANAEVFRDAVHHALASTVGQVRLVVIAAEPITHVDSTAAEVLAELDDELGRQGVELAFAELKGPVKDRLRRYGLFDRISEERFYPTIGFAVSAYLAEHAVPWRDWEDEPTRRPSP